METSSTDAWTSTQGNASFGLGRVIAVVLSLLTLLCGGLGAVA